jgi:hypothetical protein
MTLTDLLTTLDARGALPASRVKDLKTSLRYLAAALGHASPEQCPVGDACRDPATWGQALDTHFATVEAQGRTISAVTRRNTRNNLRVLFRLAAAHQLLTAPLPSRLLPRSNRETHRQQQRATAPYKTTYGDHRGQRYWVPQAEWPPDIVQGWRTYKTRCGLRIRETSFQSYVKLLETYIGYCLQVGGCLPAWDDLFDVPTLTAFLRWHGQRLGRPLTVHGRQVAIVMATIANVLEHPARQALATLRQGLKKPAPLHNKRLHWVTLAQLEEVAEACLGEGRTPLVPHGKPTGHPGAQRAGRFQRGVMLKLLVRVPLRQRNLREMQFGKHLVQDPTTREWHLEFSGADLKIGNRGPHVNEYKVNLSTYCPEWIPLLDEWRTVHRPKLPNAATSPFVFLTQLGKPHIQKTLHMDLAEAVSLRTGQRFYPHLIRTIWATEYLEATQDFATAATMLGDQLRTVIQTYYDVVHKGHYPKARAFLAAALAPR